MTRAAATQTFTCAPASDVSLEFRAGLLITTEAMVAEPPKEEAAAMPGGGGMGGMGGMM